MALKTIKVAELFLIEDDNQIVGSEIGFTDAVTEAQGAVTTMNVLRKSLDDTGWVTRAVVNVAERSKSDDAALTSEPETTEDDSPEDSNS